MEDKMNRKWFWLLGIVFVLLVFGACNSLPAPTIFDENLSVAESAHLFFDYGLEITEYNGISIEHKRFLGSTNSKWRYVYLPPGEMEFMADVNSRRGDFIYTAREVYFNYKFDAGKTYSLFFTPYGGDDNRWGVNIYEEPEEGKSSNNRERIAFVPFYKRGN
jgi:hypothetical protein